ncbi:hypothetical protein BKA83DRAFT_4318015 [Pisolithus microcarpus]|nr:hypothetical protein BKA83DRAFT_4318015 [Pisolithus microcarpus]
MHGVIDTDNVSIAGLTIDHGKPILHFVLGPYAFMDVFDPRRICNRSDQEVSSSLSAPLPRTNDTSKQQPNMSWSRILQSVRSAKDCGITQGNTGAWTLRHG